MRLSSRRFKFTILALALLALTGWALTAGRRASAHSTTFDAVADFSIAQNPNGAWSYGFTQTRGTAFSLMTLSNSSNANRESRFATSSGPYVIKNKTSATVNYSGTIVHPPDLLNLDPSSDGRNAVVRWTAPAAGTFRIAGRFQGIDNGGTTTDVAVLKNSAETIFSANINGFGAQASFDLTIVVNAGDAVDFSVGKGAGGSSNDSTGLAAAITPVAAGSCISPATGMVSWYRAEGDANDEQGANNGMLQNGASFGAGQVGQAFSLDGTNDYVAAPDADALDLTGVITIEAWVNPSDISGERIIASKRSADGNDITYTLRLVNGQPEFTWRQGGGGINGVGPTAFIPANQFSHLAVTISGGSTYTFYINGQSVASSTSSALLNRPATNGQLTIGAGLTSDGAQGSFAGLLDEAAIYNRALSQSEIQAVFDAGSAGRCAPQCASQPANMTAWYRAEGDTNDSQGTNNGTPQDGATFAAGRVGQAFKFDGAGDHVSVPDAPALRPTSLTAEAWVRLSSPPGGGTGPHIISKPVGTGTFNSYSIWISDGRFFARAGNSTHSPVNLDSGVMAAAGAWYHVALTFDDATKTETLYVNGVQRASATFSAPLSFDNHPLLIGAESNNETLGFFFPGLIDEAAIYDRALSPTEIRAIFEAGGEGKCAASPSPTPTPTLTPTPTTTPTPTPTPTPVPSCVDAPFNLVHWYRLDGNFSDAIGRVNASANDVDFVAGKVGQAARFNGVGASATSLTTNILNNLPVTIEAWVKPEERNDGTDFPTNTVSNDSPNQHGHGFGLNVFPGGSQLKVEYHDGSRVIPNVSFTAGQWYHIVVAYKTGRVRTTVNGSLVDDFEFAQGSVNGASRIYIGKHNDDAGLGTRRFFKGQIDEVSIYTGFLNLGNIRDLHGADVAGKCSLVQATSNDNIQSARVLNGDINNPVTEDRSGSVNGTNVGATRQVGNFLPGLGALDEPPHDGKAGGKSVWYAWRAPYKGSVKFDVKNSSFDTLLAVYAKAQKTVNGAVINEFVKIASNDDAPCTAGGQTNSRVRFIAQRGVTYYVAVDGLRAATGNFELQWEQSSSEVPGPTSSALKSVKNLRGEFLAGLPVGVTDEGQRTVIVTGRGFTANSRVLVNGEPIQTTFHGDGTRLEALIPACFFAREGDLYIRVQTGNELAAYSYRLSSVPLDVTDVQPGQSFNTSGPGAPQSKPSARYTLQGTNPGPQKVRIGVALTYFQQLGQAVGNAFRPLTDFFGGIGNTFGTWAKNGPPPPGKPVGDVKLLATLNPAGALPGVQLSFKPGTPLTGTDAAKLIGTDGASLKDKVSLVAAGAGNLIGTDGSTLIGTDGSTLIGTDGSTLIGTDGSTLIGTDGSTLIGTKGGTLQQSLEVLSGGVGLRDADEDFPIRRIGWYVFRDAQGGNGNIKTVTEEDGSVFLEAEMNVAADTLPRVADLNRTEFAIVLDPSYLSFAQNTYTVSEGGGSLTVTVRRTNNTEGPATVNYQTTSQAAPEFAAPAGTASDRSDYTPAFGTLFFAPGETEKTFTVSITDDGLGGAGDGAQETFNILLNAALGAAVDGTGSARVTITDNDSANAPTNPVQESQFFVRQHYRDFLNREPDAEGLAFWTGDIEKCGADAGCREVKRIHVSAAFFLSIEFQETGFLVSRMHAASFGGFPQKLRMQEFLLSTQAVGRGVVVGRSGWEQRLEENRQAFLNLWVDRPDFLTLYAGKTNEEYVNALFANAGVGAGEEAGLRQQIVAGLDSGAETRATALRKVVESRAVREKLFNPSFVQMQFFGYLRRNPNDAPDADFSGYNFWLAKLDSFNGDFIRAEMVKAFLDSIEYRKRFGQ